MKLFGGFNGFGDRNHRAERPSPEERERQNLEKRNKSFEVEEVPDFEALATAMERRPLKMAFTVAEHPDMAVFKAIAEKESEATSFILSMLDTLHPQNKSGKSIEEQIREESEDVEKRHPKYPQEMMVALDAILADVQRARTTFQDYAITSIEAVTHFVATKKEAEWLAALPYSNNWHRDSRADTPLRVLRTYYGQSTEYAANEHGDHKMTLPNQAITVHRSIENGLLWPNKRGRDPKGLPPDHPLDELSRTADAAWHRRPVIGVQEPRFLLMINMVKKSKLENPHISA